MVLKLTDHIDLTLVLLYLFWILFAVLIYYLHRESKREGYPLMADPSSRGRPVPMRDPVSPKTFLLDGGHSVTVSGGRPDKRDVKVAPVAPWPGAPMEPTGNPMQDGVGPASYAERADHPDVTIDGKPKIVPLRIATDFFLESRDPDPRGMPVRAGDRKIAGKIIDCWVDRSEYIMRYYEVELENGRKVLLPSNFVRIDTNRREANVKAIFARQFADVPQVKTADQISLLEEDMICGYFGGGYLYASPSRTESLL